MPAANSHREPQTSRSTPADGETVRILHRLAEPGACLALAPGMENGVVVRETGAATERMAIVNRGIAEAMALKDWIACSRQGRVARYRITDTGRDALLNMTPESDTDTARNRPGSAPSATRPASATAEAPLVLLSRRRNPDGSRFLSPEQVAAGERLREDYELARLASSTARDWDRIVADAPAQPPGFGEAPARFDSADDRVSAALRSLGPGLGDVTLRCCCLLEGMEATERRMGWSARSGKIVLRIALQRLADHYAAQGDAGRMIG